MNYAAFKLKKKQINYNLNLDAYLKSKTAFLHEGITANNWMLFKI